ncbi:MAG: site-specific integrase, partial [Pyrinomonadaceae bacterium]
MAGQIIKRGRQTWLVRIFTGRDAKGKRRYFNKTIHGTKKEADKYLSATLTAISTGTFVEASPLTLSAYLDRWLEVAARPRLTERTYTSYEWLLKQHVRPAIGERKLADVRPLHVQAIYSHMLAPKLKDDETPKPGVTYGLGLSACSVRYTHAVLSSALKQAVRWHMLARNPCEAVELPRKVPREMQAFAPDEAARFLKAAAEDKHGTLFTFALATGMRPEEYLALRWSDVDLQKGAATVQR